MGHSVTVFERRSRLGGMMRYGIPAYRLPRERLDDIRAVLVPATSRCVRAATFRRTRCARWWTSSTPCTWPWAPRAARPLSIEGADAAGVMSAVDVLEAIGDEQYPDFTGKNVVVVGGGNVAMDCARTAVRAGAASVTVAYRRRLEDMTALPPEVEAAMMEGVEMRCLQAPARIEANAEGTRRRSSASPSASARCGGGRPAPVPADKPEVRLAADLVIIAVGQAIECAPFEEFGMQHDRTYLCADACLQAPGFDAVFVGGDCQWGPKTVIMAIAAGKTAAANIDGCWASAISWIAAPPCRRRTQRPHRLRARAGGRAPGTGAQVRFQVRGRTGERRGGRSGVRPVPALRRVRHRRALTGRGLEAW